MLTREATYEDYGFSEEEDKKFNEFCRKLEMRDKILLLQCAAEVYPNVCDELYCCIVIGMSYDKMNKRTLFHLIVKISMHTGRKHWQCSGRH